MRRAIAIALCLLAAACAARPTIGIVITNSPDSLECGSTGARGACR